MTVSDFAINRDSIVNVITEESILYRIFYVKQKPSLGKDGLSE